MIIYKWTPKTIRQLQSLIYQNGSDYRVGFDAWVHDNKHIFDHIVEKAFEMRNRGRTRYAIATLWEVARHHGEINQLVSDLNNNWATDVSKLIMQAYPLLKGFFELRSRTTNKLGCYPK